MEDSRFITPAEVYQADERTLGIRWQDGHESLYPCETLRKACRCAACIDEMTGRPILDPQSVPSDVHPVEIINVGRYGLRMNWSDGHNTGIYTFKYLREICQCQQCLKKDA